MNNDIINQIASKLQVPVEVLWAALIKQAPISATIYSISFGIAFLAAIILFIIGIKCGKDSEGRVGFWVGAGLVFLVTFLAFSANAEFIFSGFFNPQYWAVHNILSCLQNNH